MLLSDEPGFLCFAHSETYWAETGRLRDATKLTPSVSNVLLALYVLGNKCSLAMIHQHIHLPCPPAAFAVQNIEIQQNKYSYYYFSIIIFTRIIITGIILVGVSVRNQF